MDIISKNKRLLWIFLQRFSMFGNDQWLDWFLLTFPTEKILYDKLDIILTNVIMSDNPKGCEIIFSKFEDYLKDEKYQKMAVSRGKMGVINALNIKINENNVYDDVYLRPPKSEEFEYH